MVAVDNCVENSRNDIANAEYGIAGTTMARPVGTTKPGDVITTKRNDRL